jgi:hypothetical protein
MGDRAGSYCSGLIREIKKLKKRNNYKKINFLIFFLQNFEFFKKKTENDLTRWHFLAVGLAYADGKG